MPSDNTQQPTDQPATQVPADTGMQNPAPVAEPVVPTTEVPAVERPVVPTTETPAADTETPAPAEPTTQVTQ